MSYNDNGFGSGFFFGGFVLSFLWLCATVCILSYHIDSHNSEMVKHRIKQYDTKTGELVYVTPQDSI
jgi:hypothetical protein